MASAVIKALNHIASVSNNNLLRNALFISLIYMLNWSVVRKELRLRNLSFLIKMFYI